jgi:hypothetical protein
MSRVVYTCDDGADDESSIHETHVVSHLNTTLLGGEAK